MPVTGVKTVMSSRSILRSSLVKEKQPRPDRKKKGVAYEVPCNDCPCVYIGETGRTLEKKCISEHKTAVKKNDPKNGIAVHSWTNSTRSTGKPPQSNRRKEAIGEEGS